MIFLETKVGVNKTYYEITYRDQYGISLVSKRLEVKGKPNPREVLKEIHKLLDAADYDLYLTDRVL